MIEDSGHGRSVALTGIQFHPASYADSHGRLFIRNGNVLRGIDPEWSDFFESLIVSSNFRSLVSDNLVIETQPTNHSLKGYPFVVQHRKIDVVSYPFEWCFDALKNAALHILSLQERLLAEGLTLQDAHPWNVMFDGCRPIYIDIGSIMPDAYPGIWTALEEFRHFVLNPLVLMSQGHAKIARAIFYRDQGISDREMASLCRPFLESWTTKLRKTIYWIRKIQTVRALPLAVVLQQLRTQIEGLSFPEASTDWSAYYEEFPAPDLENYSDLKRQGALQVLLATRPRSVLDVASNRGWYSQLAAARLGCNVISFDIDEPSIIQLFRDCTRDRLPVHPLVMDLSNPSAGVGPLSRAFAPAPERFKSEMVLALAIVHHLVFKRMLRFEQIAETLAMFSSRWLLVEFVPKEDRFVSEWWSERYAWYTLTGFTAELSKYFSKIEVIASEPAPRVLLLCEI